MEGSKMQGLSVGKKYMCMCTLSIVCVGGGGGGGGLAMCVRISQACQSYMKPHVHGALLLYFPIDYKLFYSENGFKTEPQYTYDICTLVSTSL